MTHTIKYSSGNPIYPFSDMLVGDEFQLLTGSGASVINLFGAWCAKHSPESKFQIKEKEGKLFCVRIK